MSSPSLSSANNEPGPASIDLGCRLHDHGLVSACEEQVPLVDQRALRKLEEDFDSPAVAPDFVRDFAQSWEGKYQRLMTFVHRRDQARAKEAALSVKVTSIMIGASRLAQLAVHVEQFIENNDMDAATQALPCMERCGSDTRTMLLATYIR